MHQLYQDAMSIVRAYGKPDLFITFTCNPKWPEINNELLKGQEPNDRPDLIARVFKIKLKELLDDLLKNKIFGHAIAHVYVVEFQKRGLPHAHILLILDKNDKPKTVEDFDRIVQQRYQIRIYILNFMKQSLNVWYMENAVKIFQKIFVKIPKKIRMGKNLFKFFFYIFYILINKLSYPEYRGRDSGRYFKRDKFDLNNQWIVP